MIVNVVDFDVGVEIVDVVVVYDDVVGCIIDMESMFVLSVFFVDVVYI